LLVEISLDSLYNTQNIGYQDS